MRAQHAATLFDMNRSRLAIIRAGSAVRLANPKRGVAQGIPSLLWPLRSWRGPILGWAEVPCAELFTYVDDTALQ